MSKILYTPAASELCGKDDPSRGPVDGVETYYNEAGDELNVTTDELEEFERESVFTLDSDTLTDEQWTDLIGFLKLVKGYDLDADGTVAKPGANTPALPLELVGERTRPNDSFLIKDAKGRHILRTVEDHESLDALSYGREFVRAVNSHASLCAMVKELRDAAMDTPALDSSQDWTDLIEKADALLTQAKGQP